MKYKRSSATKKLTSVLIGLIVFLGLICLYNGAFFVPTLHGFDDGSAGIEGTDPVLGGSVLNRSFHDSVIKKKYNFDVPKSIPVSPSFLC